MYCPGDPSRDISTQLSFRVCKTTRLYGTCAQQRHRVAAGEATAGAMLPSLSLSMVNMVGSELGNHEKSLNSSRKSAKEAREAKWVLDN